MAAINDQRLALPLAGVVCLGSLVYYGRRFGA
jgi:hypothetical protein